jgi:DNA recombination protein RmuC
VILFSHGTSHLTRHRPAARRRSGRRGFRRAGKEARGALAQREAELAALRDEKSALAVRCATLQSELESERALFAERQATLEAARAGFADAFKAISADALAKNNQSFLELARAALEAQQATAGGANWKSASRPSANWSPR